MIELRSVGYRYPGDPYPAVDDVSMHVGASESIAIVGPNGSGKSTVGRLMKGLLFPSSGTISVDGLSTTTATIDVRRIVGLVFQNPNSQIVNSVVEGEVAFGPENMGLTPDEIRERVSAALTAVGLVGRETAECHALSMADKQRVALASVIAMEPRYLILDEPTAWIEPAARTRLLREVFRWSESRGVGLVLITHRMDEALLCERMYGVLHGRVEAEGAPSDVLGSPLHRERLALAVPEGFALSSVLRAAGLPVAPGSSIEGVAESIWQS